MNDERFVTLSLMIRERTKFDHVRFQFSLTFSIREREWRPKEVLAGTNARRACWPAVKEWPAVRQTLRNSL